MKQIHINKNAHGLEHTNNRRRRRKMRIFNLILNTDLMAKEKEYRTYISEHLDNIEKAYKRNVDAIWDFLKDEDINFCQFERRIFDHDDSKYDMEEFDAYRNKFYPIEDEIVDEEEFKLAWLHHIHNNPHHWNYWVMVDIDGVKALEMPKEYLIEMVLDWIAMGMKNNNSALEYYEKNKNKILLHFNTRKELEKLLEILK